MFRKAVPHDTGAIAAAWLAVLEARGVNFPDEQQARTLIRHCISGGYCTVAEGNGTIEAALVARVHDRLWRRRKQTTLVAWFNRGAPTGTGFAMLREWLAWANARPAIRSTAIYCELPDSDRLLSTVGARYGFDVQVIAR